MVIVMFYRDGRRLEGLDYAGFGAGRAGSGRRVRGDTRAKGGRLPKPDFLPRDLAQPVKAHFIITLTKQ